MHLPLLHISSRRLSRDTVDEDPLRLGKVEGRDLIPWLADPVEALRRAERRTLSLDIVSLVMAALGSEVTYFTLMSGLFSMYDRQTALTFAGAIIPTVAVNQIVKVRFRFPRPPRKAMHPYAFVARGDHTFPSGHAQNAVALGLFLVSKGKRQWVRMLGLTLGVAIPLSRVYLGVHYPRDVIAGAMLGAGSLAGVAAFEKPFRRWWFSKPRGSRGFTVALSCGILGLLTGSPMAAFPLGIGGGLALGHDLSGMSRFQMDRPTGRQRYKQGVLGALVFLGTSLATRPLLKRESTIAASLAGGLVGIALTFGVPFTNSLMKRIALAREKRAKADARMTKGGGRRAR